MGDATGMTADSDAWSRALSCMRPSRLRDPSRSGFGRERPLAAKLTDRGHRQEKSGDVGYGLWRVRRPISAPHIQQSGMHREATAPADRR